MENQETTKLDQLKRKDEDNNRYFLAVLGLVIAYQNVRGEDQMLDMFLLGTAQELSNRINLTDQKLDPKVFDDLLAKINSGEEELSISLKSANEHMESFLNGLATPNN